MRNEAGLIFARRAPFGQAQGRRGKTDIRAELLALAEPKYKSFVSKLIPTLEKERIIGARMPLIRALARRVGAEERVKFMRVLPHFYLEENLLHMLFIGEIRDFDGCAEDLSRFLPYVDNWEVCDIVKPAALKTDMPRLYGYISRWLSSEKPYTVRYAVGLLMAFSLDENFEVRQASRVAAVKAEDYYVKTSVAWYFATALAKQYGAAVPFFEKGVLSRDVHNKTIRKAVESFRVTKAHKDYIRTLKR